MTIYAATLYPYPVTPGTVLIVDGVPQANDMLRIQHANKSHTAALIEAVVGDLIVLALQGAVISLRRRQTEDEGSTWVAE